MGKLNLLAKGARRKKSPFLGRVELFTRCALTYYENSRRGLNILSECDLVSPFAGLRTSVERFTSACYFARLVDSATRSGQAVRGIFELLDGAFGALDSSPDASLLARYFELRLLSLLGYSLRLDACARCARNTLPLHFFSAGGGGMICRTCGAMVGGAVAVSPGTLALTRSLAAAPLELVARIAMGRAQSRELKEILHRALRYHLEFEPAMD